VGHEALGNASDNPEQVARAERMSRYRPQQADLSKVACVAIDFRWGGV
jgi:hypothetical protein